MADECSVIAVWLDENEKIVSFHYVEGYDVTTVHSHNELMALALSLSCRGYRVQ